MWGQTPAELFRRSVNLEDSTQDLHTTGSVRDSYHSGTSVPEDVFTTWGEREAGGPVLARQAMGDFEDLRRGLSELDRSTMTATPRSPRPRSISRVSDIIARERNKRKSQTDAAAAGFNVEMHPVVEREPIIESQPIFERESIVESQPIFEREPVVEKQSSDDSLGQSTKVGSENDFQLDEFLKEGVFEQRNVAGGPAKKVGVIYKGLTVKGVGGGTAFVHTLPHAILGTFGPDLYGWICRFFPALDFRAKPEIRDLIRNFTGVVKHGEMMLVLGKPGSGCSTFLKALANHRSTFAAVEGEVLYSGITAAEQAKHYRGEVVYNPERDTHLPSLNVWQTLKFSLLNKTKKQHTGEVNIIIEALLKMFAMSHTKNTVVGNEFVRGVSGGERKRVSIAETLATRSTLVCWDNATRGLDASTALDYANSLRIMTDVSDRTTITTLYQAGEDIYQLMDKVLVIEEGRMIYQGPIGEARKYFVDLGFHAPDRQTTPDFLTSVGDPNERKVCEGWEDRIPRTPEDLEKAFRRSDAYAKVLAEVANYEKYLKETKFADAKGFQRSVTEQKSRTVSRRSNYTVSFWRQVLACTKREFWLLWGDRPTLYTQFFIIISCGAILGSLFIHQPTTTAGAFSRGGTAFISILFLGWLQFAELMKALAGRDIINRHKEYAFYRPSAVTLARTIVDIPVLLSQSTVFAIIFYWMSGLMAEPSNFFIYLLIVYTSALCLTALYRMMAALSPGIDGAVRFAGIAFNILIIFTGYVIPKTLLLSKYIWFGWLYYISPVAYSFEAVLTNELSSRQMECADTSLVPQGPGFSAPYQGCAIGGAKLGSTVVSGSDYLATSYQYSRDNLWRNFGIVLAFTVFYIFITAMASEKLSFAAGGGGALTFKKSNKTKKHASPPRRDEERAGEAGTRSMAVQKTRTQDEVLGELSQSESIFTWSNVSYTVPVVGGERKLLDNVSGYAKPGVMVALMGASGAGKTTLLNTLSQRQRMGVVTGDMLVDGRTLRPDFQRSTGFVEQMDLHEETATIREALEFSALLRQDQSVPREEKIAYVDNIIALLEMEQIEDAIISSLGVEQKKRLTIGVELAAKPSLLLFLDEPTSGLDANAAFSIVRFLKKLSQAGQAIICTIHQPSSMLIQQFDMILALNPGGSTIYFGPVGDNGSEVVKYFGDRGVHCPPDKNVAEFLLETAIKGGSRADGKRLDWTEEWRESRNNANLAREIDRINATRSRVPAPPATSQRAFAASTWEQSTLLTKRMFVAQWRDPSYVYSKLFVSVIIGIFIGFTFYSLGNTVADLQNRLFVAFMILLLPPTFVNGVLPKFYMSRAIWEVRELPSRIYGWVAFCTASVVTEVPSAVVGGTIYFLLYYFPAGLPQDASTAGYVYIMTVLFYVFLPSLGQWICAFAPSFTVISNVLPFFFIMFSLFNGVVVPYSELSVFWRYWMYYVNPSQWYMSGVMGAIITGVQVKCAPSEAAYFNPPPGQTCAQYAGNWVSSVGRGYLTNPEANASCGYCPYKTGDEYLATLNVSAGDKWRDFGIFLVFVFSNWALVYFFIYTVRIKGWTFGMGPLFDIPGKIYGGIKSLFTGKGKDVEQA